MLNTEKQDLQSETSPVINLSSQIISSDQLFVLSRGLGFAPTNNFNMFYTLLDINKFARTLTLKHHFFKSHDNLNNSLHDNDFVEDLSISEYTVSSDSITSSPLPSSFVSFNLSLCNVGTLRSLEAESGPPSYEGAMFRLPNPNFYPIQSRPGVLDVFQERVEKDLSELHSSIRWDNNISKLNLSNREFWALKSLSSNKDLVVKRQTL